MKKNIRKNRISSILALVCLCALVVGSLAYFTDRVDNSGSPLNITLDDKPIDIRPVDPSDPDPTDPDPDPGTTIEDIWDVKNGGSVEGKDVYPGAEVDLSYDLYNGSDAAVDIRETIVLTVKNYQGNALALQDDLGLSEYEVWKTSEVNTTDGYVDGKIAMTDYCTTIDRTGANTIVYHVKPFTLDGANETITGSAGRRADMNYKLVMDHLAKNAFQASTCQVDYVIEAKQHAEGGADKGWTEVSTKSITIGGVANNSVVPDAAGN